MLLNTAVKLFLEQTQLTTETLIVAVSGGADSVALLHALHQYHAADKLVVAHLNHQLRGVESDRDQMHVQAIIKQWRLPNLVVRKRRVADGAHLQRESVEMAARRVRYQFLADVAANYNAHYIFTAHHADDQNETIVLNFLNGTGLAGLRGMRTMATVPYTDDVRIRLCRPLLGVARHDIEIYCAEHHIAFVEDSSNHEQQYLRNRVRHEVMPMLRAINPNLTETLSRAAAVISAENDLLTTLTDDALNIITQQKTARIVVIDRTAWQALPLAIQRRTLRRTAAQLRLDMRQFSFAMAKKLHHVALYGRVGAQAELPTGWIMVVGYETLTIRHSNDMPDKLLPQLSAETPRLLTPHTPISLGNGWLLTATWHTSLPWSLITKNRDKWQAFVGLPPQTALFVRGRLAGEKIQPLGMQGSKKIQDVMVESKISADLRTHWPLVATTHYPVWIVGYLLDDRAKIETANQTVLHLHAKRQENKNES